MSKGGENMKSKNNFEEKLGEDFLVEKWKPVIIDGEISHFSISSFGNISGKYNQLLKPYKLTPHKPKSYLCIKLKYRGNKYHYLLHRLVAEAFIPNPENKPMVNHIDGNKLNNHFMNLEWVTGKENMQHAVKNNLLNPRYGETSPFAKHTNEQIHEVCKLLELGTHTIGEISHMTGVKYKTIRGIVASGKWKMISDQYDIKSPIMMTKRNPVTEREEDIIHSHFISGDTDVKNIISDLGWDQTILNKQVVRYRLRKYKASTTIPSGSTT